MPIYTIIATITNIEDDYFQVKGLGKYLFEDNAGKFWNTLEEYSTEKSKMVDLKNKIFFGKKKLIKQSTLIFAFLMRKPLKLEIEENNKCKYTLKSISLADV